MILHLLRMRRKVNRNVFNDRKNLNATPPLVYMDVREVAYCKMKAKSQEQRPFEKHTTNLPRNYPKSTIGTKENERNYILSTTGTTTILETYSRYVG